MERSRAPGRTCRAARSSIHPSRTAPTASSRSRNTRRNYFGRDVHGARLRFENGRAVEISAGSNEDFFKSVLTSDEGASVLGEFGIGCNPGIQDHMRNTLFDEKIEGTIHLAM